MVGGKQLLGLPLNCSLWVRVGSTWEGGCLAQAMALERKAFGQQGFPDGAWGRWEGSKEQAVGSHRQGC